MLPTFLKTRTVNPARVLFVSSMQFLSPVRCISRQSYPTVQRIGCLINFQSIRLLAKVPPKVVKLPEEPKEPTPPFQCFFLDVRKNLELKFPEASHADILKAASEMWKHSDDKFKAHFLAAYKEASSKYKLALREYETRLTPDQLSMMKEKKNEKKALKSMKMSDKCKKKNVLGKPKKPPNPFALFVSSKKGMFQEHKKSKDFIIEMSEIWKILPETEKHLYVSEAAERRRVYAIELRKWAEEHDDSADNDSVNVSEERRHKGPMLKNKPNDLSTRSDSETTSIENENKTNLRVVKKDTKSDNPESTRSVIEIVSSTEKRGSKIEPKLLNSCANIVSNSERSDLVTQDCSKENSKPDSSSVGSRRKTKTKSSKLDIKTTSNSKSVIQQTLENRDIEITSKFVEIDPSRTKSLNKGVHITSTSEKEDLVTRSFLEKRNKPTSSSVGSYPTTETKSLKSADVQVSSDSEEMNSVIQQSSEKSVTGITPDSMGCVANERKLLENDFKILSALEKENSVIQQDLGKNINLSSSPVERDLKIEITSPKPDVKITSSLDLRNCVIQQIPEKCVTGIAPKYVGSDPNETTSLNDHVKIASIFEPKDPEANQLFKKRGESDDIIITPISAKKESITYQKHVESHSKIETTGNEKDHSTESVWEKKRDQMSANNNYISTFFQNIVKKFKK